MSEGYYILTGIISGSDAARYDGPYTIDAAQVVVDDFIQSGIEKQSSILNNSDYSTDPLSYSKDAIIIKIEDSDGSVEYDRKTNTTNVFASALASQIFGMPTGSAQQTFDNIFSIIAQDLSPPRQSQDFTYDFKFCQNQNGSITTGSVAPASTISVGSSGRGGY